MPSRTGVWFAAEFAEQQPNGAQRLLRMLRNTPAEGYATCCDAIGAFDVRDRLGEISAPTLVIAGAEDRATPPALVREVADSIRGATFVVVPGAGHLPNATHPAPVDDVLRRHLTT